MKPFRIFLFLCTIGILIELLSVATKSGDICIAHEVNIRIPSLKELFSSDTPGYKDISQLTRIVNADSIIPVRNVMKPEHSGDSLVPALAGRPLEYPDSNRSALLPFFRVLAETRSKSPCIHIMHYGDSQLEADRITDYLRFRFQTEFGGGGPGLLAITPEISRNSLQASGSDNWCMLNLFKTPYSLQGKRAYGPLAGIFRYTPAEDSLKPKYPVREAWFSVKGMGNSTATDHSFTRFRIFYENKFPGTRINILAGDLKKTDTLSSNGKPDTFLLDLEKPGTEIKLTINGAHSPDFYGICLDQSHGITVDNIPIRGSSGLEFSRMDPELLKSVLMQINARLLILQFGVNAIPGNLPDYSYYENRYYNQLLLLKRLDPDLCIVVISVSDASLKVGDTYESYPSVEKIVAAQRNAALKAGCAFWNLYEAMGGKNSMPAWVLAKTPLASPDFLHFNSTGARMVAKMFYSALIHDYNEFLTRQN